MVYRSNVVSMLQHIWHRGALVIIKKNAYMRASNKKGRWTFLGPKDETTYKQPAPLARTVSPQTFIREEV